MYIVVVTFDFNLKLCKPYNCFSWSQFHYHYSEQTKREKSNLFKHFQAKNKLKPQHIQPREEQMVLIRETKSCQARYASFAFAYSCDKKYRIYCVSALPDCTA